MHGWMGRSTVSQFFRALVALKPRESDAIPRLRVSASEHGETMNASMLTWGSGGHWWFVEFHQWQFTPDLQKPGVEEPSANTSVARMPVICFLRSTCRNVGA